MGFMTIPNVKESKPGLVLGETVMCFPDGRGSGTHTYNRICEQQGGCMPYEKEKKSMQKGTVAAQKTPEFTIETRYIKSGTVVMSPGWTYVLKWVEPHPSRANQVVPRSRAGYAFETEAAARSTAEDKATEIARSLLPVNTYKFTPEV